MKTDARTFLSLGMFLSVCLCSDLFAIKDETNQDRWAKPCEQGPDAEVPGFLVNMGPTGARGILKQKSFVVKYVFKQSPAYGKLKLDDEIIGVNGKKFASHTFGGNSATGISGPIEDMGLAIEDSEGKDGVLSLMMSRGGVVTNVRIQLEKLGRFADTFPVNCKKTEILKKRAYEYLRDNSEGVNSQGRCVTILSMLSSHDKKVFSEGKKRVKDWNNVPGKDTWSWHLGFQAMTLAEYYLLTKDKSVLKTLEALMDQLRAAQWQGPQIRRWPAGEGQDQETVDKHQALYEGGFGHGPYHVVVSRAGGPGKYGGGGYGPMQRPTYLAILAWQLGKQCGVKITHPGLEQAFTFVDYGTRVSGNTAYGGEFTMNNGPINWDNWKKSTRPGNSHKSGMAYLMYMLSPERDESKAMMKTHLRNIEESYRDMPDGHACPMMGLIWGWAGVYASDDKSLKKKITEYYIAWLNMARCHGSDSYVILPGRNYADGSYYRGNIRNHTTGSIAFLYSYSTPRLQLQGGPSAVKPTSRVSPRKKLSVKKATVARKARSLSKENHAILDKSLLKGLAKLSDGGALKKIPLAISVTRAKVWLKKASTDGSLTFVLVGGSKAVDLKWANMKDADRVTLSQLVAVLKPESGNAQAMAAVYMESLGRVAEADKYFEKAGPEAKAKLEQLF